MPEQLDALPAMILAVTAIVPGQPLAGSETVRLNLTVADLEYIKSSHTSPADWARAQLQYILARRL